MEKKGENQILIDRVQSVNKSITIPKNMSYYGEDVKQSETIKLHCNGLIESGKVNTK